jgi:hypothetical protein
MDQRCRKKTKNIKKNLSKGCRKKIPYILLRANKAKISPQNPTTEFGLQNQYSRVIYLSIGNKKKIGCKKGGNKPSEPKHRFFFYILIKLNFSDITF